MKLILNEKEHAEHMIAKGIIGKKVTQTLKLLTKYYLSLGMNEHQVVDSIKSFMKKNYPKYNSVKWEDIISDIVRKVTTNKKPLLHIEKIPITSSELGRIRSIGNPRLEKVAFVLLVYAKIYNEINGNKKYWVNCDLKDVFGDVKIALNPKDQALMIHKLVKLGLVEPSNRVDCVNLKVKFAYEQSEVVIEISDFRDFVLEYLRFIGEKIDNCEKCGIRMMVTGRNQKMCRACWKEREKQLWRENKRKKRSVQVFQ